MPYLHLSSGHLRDEYKRPYTDEVDVSLTTKFYLNSLYGRFGVKMPTGKSVSKREPKHKKNSLKKQILILQRDNQRLRETLEMRYAEIDKLRSIIQVHEAYLDVAKRRR